MHVISRSESLVRYSKHTPCYSSTLALKLRSCYPSCPFLHTQHIFRSKKLPSSADVSARSGHPALNKRWKTSCRFLGSSWEKSPTIGCLAFSLFTLRQHGFGSRNAEYKCLWDVTSLSHIETSSHPHTNLHPFRRTSQTQKRSTAITCSDQLART
jgi:hypothetical protein